MDVWRVAESTFSTLRDLGKEHVCFIGGVACCLYTNHREPKVGPAQSLILWGSADS